MQAFVEIGMIARPRGLVGEVWVNLFSDDPERLARLRSFYIEGKNGRQELRVKKARVQDGRLVVHFEGVDGRNAAESLRATAVSIAREDMPTLEEGEVFMTDLVGLRAILEDGQTVGQVHDVLDMPAGWLLDIRKGKVEALVPYKENFVPDVDLEAGTLTLRPIEGLLPDEMLSVPKDGSSDED
jgi:16S rRNA processing protein RimM